ncbi:MAG: type III secretion system chaperone [Acetobacteraceae bacterium]|nr:type III secretion system chaperone [Pseudomonadota bacterium]
MSIDAVRSVLRDLGAGIGLPELAPDDDGYCCLKIGEQITVSMQYESEEQNLVLFARLCAIDPVFREEAYEMLLAGNLFWAQTGGATLAVEPAGGEVMLQAKESTAALDLPRFNRMLQSFVDTGEAWIARLKPFAATPSETAEEPEYRLPAYVTLA